MLHISDTQSKRTLTQHTVGGLLWLFSSAGIQHALKLLTIVLLARIITPADFGVMAAAMVVVNFSHVFSLIGIGPSLVHLSRLESSYIRTGFTLSVLFGFFVGGIVYLMAPLTASFFRVPQISDVLRLLSIVFPLSGFAVVSESLMRRAFKFRDLAITEVCSYGLGYAVTSLLLAFKGFEYWSLVGAVIVQHSVRAFILSVMQPHQRIPQLELRTCWELLRLGGGYTIAQILNFFALQGDYFVVGRWLGATVLGFYTRAYSMMSIFVRLLGHAMNSSLFPAIAKIQDDRNRLGAVMQRSLAGVCILILPSSIFLSILAPEFVHVVLGPGWGKAVVPFQILALGMYFRIGYKVSCTLSQAIGAVYENARRQAVYAALVLFGAWAGQHWGGLEGAALGVLFALFLFFLIMSHLSLQLTSMTLRDFINVHMPAIRLSILVGIQSWVVAEVLRNFDFHSLLIIGATLASVSLSSLILINCFGSFFLGENGLWLLNMFARLNGLKKTCQGS